MSNVSRYCEVSLVAATLAIGAFLWSSHQVVVDDHAHYITSGISLMSGRGFTSPLGSPETWFPPFYPVLIGLLNFLTGDGMLAAKLVSLTASVLWVLAVYRVGRSIGGDTVGLAAAAILVVQPDRALLSVLSMSQAVFSALLWSAVAVYIADLKDARQKTAPLTGLLLGLAALTRPEGILPAGLIVVDRAVRLWPASRRRAVARAGMLAAAFGIVVLPYTLYLYQTTGKLSPTGKTEINLAVGRAHATGQPLYRIEPATLELALNSGQGGTRDLVRYARNLRNEVRLIAGQLDYVWLAWVGLGVWLLLEARSTSGVIAAWAASPLAVMPLFVMAPPFVVPYLPAFTIAAAAGIVRASRVCLGGTWPRTPTVATALLVVGTVLWGGVGAAQDLQSFRDPGREAMAERQAGEWLGRAKTSPGSVLAVGGTVAYYSGLHQRHLTRDDLALVLAYMQAQRIPYLSVSSRDGDLLHATVQDLLRVDQASGLRLIHAAVDASGSVCRVFALNSPSAR